MTYHTIYRIKKIISCSVVYFITFSIFGQNVEWVNGTGSEDGNDVGTMIQVDTEGNVFMSGLFTGYVSFDPNSNDYDFYSGPYANVFLQKFDADGNFLWAKVFLSNEPEYPLLEIDSNNNIYITSEYKGSIDLDPGPNEDIRTCPVGSWNSYIVKLDNDGNYLWGKDFQINSSDKYATIQSFAKDNNNNFLISGVFHGTIDFDFGQNTYNVTGPYNHGFFLKIDEEGNFQWVRTIGGIFNYFELIKTVYDHNNNIIIGGSFAGPFVDFDPSNGEAILSTSEVNNHDLFILKLDELGNFEWVRKAEGHFFDIPPPSNWAGDDTLLSLAVDSNNDLYFTGGFYNSINFEPDTEDFILDIGLDPCTEAPCERIQTSFIAKMNSDGNMVWAKNYEGDNRLYLVGVNLRSAINKVWINNEDELYFGLNPYGTMEVEVNNEIHSYSSDNRFLTFLHINPSDGSAKNVYFIGNEFHAYLNDLKVVSNEIYATGGFLGGLYFDSQHLLTTSSIFTNAYALKMKDPTLDVNQVKKDISILYPNPTKGVFYINTSDTQILNVSIFDIQGRFLKNYNSPNQDSSFDVSTFSNGIYLVQVKSRNGSSSTFKIVKK